MRSTTIAAFRSFSALLTCKRPTSISLRVATSLSLTPANLPHHPFNRTYTSPSSRPISTMSTSTNDNLRQLEALLHRLDQDRAATQQQQPADDISPRTPNTISASSNAADKIDRHLRADGHRLWGFVVYRCTYSSDAAWRECVRRLEASVRKAMDLYNGHDLLEEGRFRLTVIEDASGGLGLDGASTGVVRGNFREWCARMLEEEQGSEEEVRSRRLQDAPLQDRGVTVRYKFCVQVDEESMRSVVSEEGERWVKLINGDWEPRGAPSGAVESQAGRDDDEGEFTDDENDDEEYPPIEGCTEEDVGWMKVQLVGLMPDFYANLRDPNLWHIQYVRPPDIATA
ncbi:hypothetical protein GE09DRAFT_558677 [Coniochaeta sp. 2T2.1]|nr:hypothetical protein GE09DRAFT_558677 [Coniochaeta sp. 2T2.1]